MAPRALPGRLLPLVLALSIATLPLWAESHGEEVERRTVNNGNVVLEDVPEVPAELAGRLHRYQNTRGATFQDWAADGAGLFVTTRFGNTNQIHWVAEPGGSRRQLTFFDEPAGGAERRPGGGDLTFLMDEGGSEFSQIFLLDPATGDYRRLTDGSSRNGAVQWAHDGRQIAFQSTRRNGKSNDVWVMDPSNPEEARLAFEAPDGAWWAAGDWSADSSRLLLMQYVSATDSRVHLLDLESGETRKLAGSAEEPGTYMGITPTFDREGTGAFITSDASGDFTQLAHIDLESGETRIFTSDIQSDVESFDLAPDGRRAAFTVNENGGHQLYLLDTESFAYERVEGLPVGLIFRLTFSPDGERLALNLNTAKTPSDVFTLELGEAAIEAGELVRWTYSEVGGLDTASFSEPELFHYPTFDEREIPAFIYRPSDDGPHPVIVYIHGGPEGQYRPSFSSTFQMWVAEIGAAVIAPNVRGSAGYGKEYVALDNGFKREDSVKDIGALLDWIAEQPDLDADRVAVYGGSYGGYMVLASLVHFSDRLTAGVDIVGISNFVTFLENTQDYRRDLRRVEYGDERDPEMRAHLEKISPNRNADKITTPLFVAQGQNDPRVPVTESEQIVRDVRAAGYDVWYMNALNEGHGFRKKENSDLYRQIVVMFLREHLLGTE
jgi:dipeptidyl aminopeptidase/acylaminoacyl peptidase